MKAGSEEFDKFLWGLSDKRLHQHLREYVRLGMDHKAALADMERSRRRNDTRR
jgi:hypothetical protein